MTPPPPEPRLNRGARLAYGAGELGPAMAGSTMIFFQLVFLTNVAGLSAGYAGSVLLIGKLWDAFNDPLIGWLSDRTRSRWGRRLPWMVASAIPFALFFVLLWVVPGFAAKDHQLALFLYYTVVAVLYSTCYTALALPHSSLTAELSSDYDERSRITGSRMAFSLGGSVGGLLIAQAVFTIFADAPKTFQYLVFALAIAIVSLGAVAACVTGVWRFVVDRDRQRIAIALPEAAMPVSEQIRVIFSNRPFLIVCGIYLTSWLAMQFTATILPFYVESVMGLPSTRFPLLALAVQGTALLLIPVWSRLSVRIGKQPVYFYGMSCWIVAQVGLLFLPRGNEPLLFVMAVVAGIGISVCYLIPNAMLPDTIEYDELQTGRRREGVFYGFFVFLQKLALALGTFIVGQALATAGYISSGPGQAAPVQPDSALTAIRIAIGPLPAAALVLGMLLTWAYPITKARHAEILAELARRRELR
ncbi:MAG: MFS transporter [Chthoniobacterales bacterium]